MNNNEQKPNYLKRESRLWNTIEDSRHGSNAIRAIIMMVITLALTSVYGAGASKTTPDEMPEFVKNNLEEIFKEKTNKITVKIHGFDEQQRESFLRDKRIWQNISPGYSNVLMDAKIDNGVITAVFDGAGLAQSKDRGKSWTQISYGIKGFARFGSFDISPADPDIIVLAGKYLSRTLDGGRSWSTIYSKVLPRLGENTSFNKIRFNSDGTRIFTALGAIKMYGKKSMAISEQMASAFKTKHVFIGNNDAGEFSVATIDSPFADLREICTHPDNPNVVYLSFADGEIYVTRNAKEQTPDFIKLNSLEGYQITNIDISPWDSTLLLMVATPHSKTEKAKVVIAEDSGKNRLEYKYVPINDTSGNAIIAPRARITSARWNPRRKDQVFVGAQGSGWVNYIIVSDNGMKSFRKIYFPDQLKHDEKFNTNGTSFYTNPFLFFFDKKSDLAITASMIGAWISSDQFKTWNDLMMTYDKKGKYYGNKGVGFAECPIYIFMRTENAYIATTDHGAFRSKGKDYTQWTRISNNSGMPKKTDGTDWGALFHPLGVSHDEKYIYVIARAGWPNNPYTSAKVKVMRSLDKGESWDDITTLLGNDDIMRFSEGQHFSTILFDPQNSNNQWLLASNALFYSHDGGKSFVKSESPVLSGTQRSYFRRAAFDMKHKILYIANHFSFPEGSSLARSFDYGKTWEEFLPGIGTIYDMDVTSSGNLVIGAYGKLLVIPYDRIESGKIDDSMIKMTTGDTPEEYAASQFTFRPIVCDDNDNVVVSVHSAWKENSNWIHGKGPLLSQDGGKSFRWIAYDLPVLEGRAAAINGEEIMIGNRGLYYTNSKKLPKELPIDCNKTMVTKKQDISLNHRCFLLGGLQN